MAISRRISKLLLRQVPVRTTAPANSTVNSRRGENGMDAQPRLLDQVRGHLRTLHYSYRTEQ
jgi:hypothetical protein